MNPKKVRQLIPKLSKELQLSEEEVESVLDVYWKYIRKKLTALEDLYIFLPELGTFYIKPWGIKTEERKYNAIINKYKEVPTARSLDIINIALKDLLKLERIKEKLEEEKALKQSIRNARNNKNLEGEG